MALATFPFKLKDYELAAYELSNIFIKLGYITDVFLDKLGYATIVYKEHYLNHVIGSPAIIKAVFISSQEGTEVEVSYIVGKVDAGRVIKDTLMVATILPGIGKLIELQALKNKVKKKVEKVVYKYKED